MIQILLFSLQALIDEDRLLSRLEVLENQLQAYSKVSMLNMMSWVTTVQVIKCMPIV